MICAKSIILATNPWISSGIMRQASFSEEVPQAGHTLATPLGGMLGLLDGAQHVNKSALLISWANLRG